VTYGQDSIIFLQGSPADLMFWIMSGLVKLYCPIADGDRTAGETCGPGDVLGYAIYRRRPATCKLSRPRP